MWPLRIKTDPTTPRHLRTRTFSCSSFKDILDLCKNESVSEFGSTSPKSPLVHRVQIPNPPLTRSISTKHPCNNINHTEPNKPIIVIYFTSLRIVRKTFEDCRSVRSILRGYRVPIDERDLSMDMNYVVELQKMIAPKKYSLPSVFIKGKYIGGAEEIKRLHESDALRRILSGTHVVIGPTSCDLCGGLRYVVCDVCNGSRKIYLEKSGFRGCGACNLNGLIKCPSCAVVHRDAAYCIAKKCLGQRDS